MTDYIVALSTCLEKEADAIATTLVESRKCACVNIIRGVTSIYRWKGKTESETESILLMKSVSGKEQELLEELCKLHSYEVPEFIILPIRWGSKDYLQWITESTTTSA
ncbi:MAG: divalent-cation tolerance protein CutA [Candidatus Thorarchaeota archaeon]|nr:divalent-cation tolerance protein CutA [Candidatus Thorarchaeota archaeon]